MDVMSVRWTLKRRYVPAGLEEYDGDRFCCRLEYSTIQENHEICESIYVLPFYNLNGDTR